MVDHLGDANLVDQLGEEAAHDEATGLGLGNAAAHQVEELLVVEAAGRGGVARALDLAVLDLEVGHGVGLGALGQHEVAVQLVGVRAVCGLADQAVADPHRVRVLALQGTLVGDAREALGLGVVHEDAVLEVLAAVHEVDAQHVQLGARAAEVRVGAQAHEVAAEGDDDVGELGVAAQGQSLVGGVQGGVIPLLQRHDGQVGAVASLDLDGLVEGGLSRARVRQDDGGLGEGGRTDHDVLGAGALNLGDVDAHGCIQLDLGGDLDDRGLLEAVPGDDCGAVAGSQDGAQALVVAGNGLDGDRGGCLDGDGSVARVVVGGLEQALDATHRGEAPVLFATAGNRDVGQVEGGRTVRARGVGLLGVGPVRVGLVHGLDNSVGGRHQPTDPSICSSMRRLSSRAYSIGSSLAIGSTKPRTIVAMASFSSRPRLMR